MPPARRSRLYLWLALTAVVSLATGLLFQAHARTGIGFYRMFGTIGLVFVGVGGTGALRTWFALHGRKELRTRIATLPADMLENVTVADGIPPAEFVLLGRQAVLAVGLDAFEVAFTAPGRRAQDRRAARFAIGLALGLKQRLGEAVPPHVTVGAVAVALRRQPQELTVGGEGAQAIKDLHWALLPLDEARGHLERHLGNRTNAPPEWWGAVKRDLAQFSCE